VRGLGRGVEWDEQIIAYSPFPRFNEKSTFVMGCTNVNIFLGSASSTFSLSSIVPISEMPRSMVCKPVSVIRMDPCRLGDTMPLCRSSSSLTLSLSESILKVYIVVVDFPRIRKRQLHSDQY